MDLIFRSLLSAIEEYTAEEEKVDAILRYKARSVDYGDSDSSDDDIKEVDEDEATNKDLEDTLGKLNQRKHQRRTLDLSSLGMMSFSTGPVNKIVSDFISKLKVPHPDSNSNIEAGDATIEDNKEPEKADAVEEVQTRKNRSSVKDRVKSMMERTKTE